MSEQSMVVLTITRECWERRHADCYGERFVPTWLICDCKCHRVQRAIDPDWLYRE